MTPWTSQMVRPGEYVLKRDGLEVGTVSFLPDVGVETIRAGVVASAMTDFDTTLASDAQARYTVRGWRSPGEHHFEMDAISAVLEGESIEIRNLVTAAWRSKVRTNPLSRAEMVEWQTVVDRIIAINTPGVAA